MTQKVNTLFTNAFVLTMDGSLTQYSPGAVAVNGDTIVAVGLEMDLTREYSADEVVDCGGKVLMPGLINAHTHVPMTAVSKLDAQSRVQAVACFYPPTDFLNYGKEGEVALGRGVLSGFRAPFDFHELDPKRRTFVPVTDEAKVLEIGRKISPVNHVSKDDPPTLIIHGDADKLVPIQQAEVMVKKLTEAGVEAKLVTKAGAAHGWADQAKDMVLIADWFDAHLKKSGGAGK